jgi:NADPH-dependent ferric siderophore reductase
MSENRQSKVTAEREPGRIKKTLIQMFMREARLAERRHLGDRFFSLRLEGAALRGVTWTPGEKIQISLGSTFATRTYTPTEWDAANGSTRILAYAHGDGPGSDWVRSGKVGDRCHLFGPRSSLDVEKMPAGALLFGDETSIGLAIALTAHHRENPPRCIFEVNAAEETLPMLSACGLPGATVIERDTDGTHLQDIIRAIDTAPPHKVAILTGKASSIQRMHRHLKQNGGSARSVVTKAYWAPGKQGLD